MKKGGLKIANVALRYGLIQAPLAGFSTSPFRRWLRRHGAELSFSEMISADGLTRAPEKQGRYIKFSDDERPIALQLFGADPAVVTAAVEVLRPLAPEIIDLNMACPVRKVVRRGAGAALLEQPELALSLAEAVLAAAPGTAVTVKARLDSGRGEKLGPLLRRFAEAGVAAVTLHPRTMREGFRGCADRQRFRELAAAAPLPLIYSGDIKCGGEAPRVYEETGAAALMIGRASIANPWIFEEARAALAGESYRPPDWADKVKELAGFRDELLELLGPSRGLFEMRKFIGYFMRGESGCRRFVQEFHTARDVAAQDRVLKNFLEAMNG